MVASLRETSLWIRSTRLIAHTSHFWSRFLIFSFRLPTNFSKPIHINLPISHAGAFVYWIEYDGSSSERITGREGYFNIDPILRVKARSSVLSPSAGLLPVTAGGKIEDKTVTVPLDGLVILTVVSKWMGTLEEWRPHLREASKRGYNMLHYTPLQQRGNSGSPYSIADQLAYDQDLVGKVTKERGTLHIKEALRIARDDFGLLSLTDVVLNHTANDSPWLVEHPEAGLCVFSISVRTLICLVISSGFSPLNTPHLAPALELDNAIMSFSATLKSNGLPTRVSSQSDIDVLLGALTTKVRDELQLWQYYVLDRIREKSGVLATLSQDVPEWSGPDVRGKSLSELAHILKSTGKILGLAEFKERYGVRVDPKDAASLLRAAFTEIQDSDALAEAWEKIVDVVNVPLYEEWEDDTKAALDSIKNRVDYTRLADHGPKLGEITAK